MVPLTLPPLKARGGDIALLAEHFVAQFAKRYGRPNLKLTAQDLARLNNYAWPGNIRELKNVIERSVLLSTGETLELSLNYTVAGSALEMIGDNPSMEELQRRYIQHVLALTGGKVSGQGGAAEILGMNRTTLYSRMHKLGLD
ncbi:MAG: Formate hydrogenlyase transcriptional activator [Deltaproteobacteria bacterium ADurb.Bin510]|nr:MAG: Formate hydrogenlyase transcriptional activator [Deltaproteobacteria bacterium ADurb.Bin510]